MQGSPGRSSILLGQLAQHSTMCLHTHGGIHTTIPQRSCSWRSLCQIIPPLARPASIPSWLSNMDHIAPLCGPNAVCMAYIMCFRQPYDVPVLLYSLALYCALAIWSKLVNAWPLYLFPWLQSILVPTSHIFCISEKKFCIWWLISVIL